MIVVRSGRHAAGKTPPKHYTNVLQGLKVLAGAVNLNAGEILYRPVFGHKFVTKNEVMQDFVASFLSRSSATAELFHVQLATLIVKCEPAWKLRKVDVTDVQPQALTAQNICSLRYHEHHDAFTLIILSLLSRYYGLYLGCIVIIIMIVLCLFGS